MYWAYFIPEVFFSSCTLPETSQTCHTIPEVQDGAKSESEEQQEIPEFCGLGLNLLA